MSSAAGTIFALSSGRPPAAIAVIRISGPGAGSALQALAGRLPFPRHATLATLRDPYWNEPLDRALLLWFPGPASATGEDCAELHLHGGRAIVDAVVVALGRIADLRQAEPGEFTRRAFENGRIDLNEAEGLADLLAAETQSQRRAAMMAAGGAVSRRVETWREWLLDLAAEIESMIDFSDEDDVEMSNVAAVKASADKLAAEIGTILTQPEAERLRDGIRVVFAGPPNVGKSSLVNALAGRNAAIASPVAGTTRDLIEVPVQIAGMPMILTDTAGLRDSQDEVEALGISRASDAIANADIVVWLGSDEPPEHEHVITVSPQCDRVAKIRNRLAVSSKTGENLDLLVKQLGTLSTHLLPSEGEVAFNRRQRAAAIEIRSHLDALGHTEDFLVLAVYLREALSACDKLVGRAGVENMLDALFARFCIGK